MVVLVLMAGFGVKKPGEKRIPHTERIDISQVPELTEVKTTDEGVTLGGAVSLTKLMTVLDDLIAKNSGDGFVFSLEIHGFVSVRVLAEVEDTEKAIPFFSQMKTPGCLGS